MYVCMYVFIYLFIIKFRFIFFKLVYKIHSDISTYIFIDSNSYVSPVWSTSHWFICTVVPQKIKCSTS
jgi:hypothetical protein